MEDSSDYTLSELCSIVPAKTYTLPVNENGRVRAVMYVEPRYEMGKTLAYFTSVQRESGYYLLADNRIDMLYVAFILNSYVGNLFLHNEGSNNHVKGNVTKRGLSAVRVSLIPEQFRKACNVLELIIGRVSRFEVDEKNREIKEATVSFLSDIRNYICLEIYMTPVFVEHQVSILGPWERFVGKNKTQYSLGSIDDTFVSFYKSVVDPDNEVMDAMKKVRMFMWELYEQIKETVGK